METTKPSRINNPLKADALTGDAIKVGTQIKYWQPGKPNSVHRVTVTSPPYVSDDGDMVVDVRHPDGRESVELTSTIGLTGDRYTGEWTAIAIPDDEELTP